ncbi:MAG: M15 family metallopeptidase [Alphaproteobacteria bacterium]|nr:M15 family metallopeptidase [Alphaproteobacteria bacterium]
MFSDASLPEPAVTAEIENPPRFCAVSESDGVFFNAQFTNDRRLRAYTYRQLLQAKARLPAGVVLMVFEGYRPLSAQKKLWDDIMLKMRAAHPALAPDSEELMALCNRFVANPYRQGSGHQSGAAVDVALCDSDGRLLDMGGAVRGFEDTAAFDCPALSETAKANRRVLKEAMASAGFVNYPAEWWHYSFGDRLWAKLTGSPIAIFGQVDL